MRRGSTSCTTLTVPESLDLTAAKAVYVTFAQGSRLLTKKTGDPGVSIEAHTVRITMTQEETLSFATGPVEIQLRWLMPDGTADGTEVAKVYNKGVLLAEVIT